MLLRASSLAKRMHFISSLKMYRTFTIAALLQLAFSMSLGPIATQFHLLSNEEMAMKGTSPAPTPAPRKRDPASLFKRQAEVSIGVETCGFSRGDWSKAHLFSSGLHVLRTRLVSRSQA